MAIEIKNHPERRGFFQLTSELSLQKSPEQVFEFFADAFQLQKITPPWLHFSVLTPAPIEMRRGTIIDYRLRLHGIPIRWRTHISVWDPPNRFIDEQLVGPYRFWRHLHAFDEMDGGTSCRDQVDYAVPGGPLVHWSIVKRDVRQIFEYRRARLTDIFSDTERSPAPIATRK